MLKRGFRNASPEEILVPAPELSEAEAAKIHADVHRIGLEYGSCGDPIAAAINFEAEYGGTLRVRGVGSDNNPTLLGQLVGDRPASMTNVIELAVIKEKKEQLEATFNAGLLCGVAASWLEMFNKVEVPRPDPQDVANIKKVPDYVTALAKYRFDPEHIGAITEILVDDLITQAKRGNARGATNRAVVIGMLDTAIYGSDNDIAGNEVVKVIAEKYCAAHLESGLSPWERADKKYEQSLIKQVADGMGVELEVVETPVVETPVKHESPQLVDTSMQAEPIAVDQKVAVTRLSSRGNRARAAATVVIAGTTIAAGLANPSPAMAESHTGNTHSVPGYKSFLGTIIDKAATSTATIVETVHGAGSVVADKVSTAVETVQGAGSTVVDTTTNVINSAKNITGLASGAESSTGNTLSHGSDALQQATDTIDKLDVTRLTAAADAITVSTIAPDMTTNPKIEAKVARTPIETAATVAEVETIGLVTAVPAPEDISAGSKLTFADVEQLAANNDATAIKAHLDAYVKRLPLQPLTGDELAGAVGKTTDELNWQLAQHGSGESFNLADYNVNLALANLAVRYKDVLRSDDPLIREMVLKYLPHLAVDNAFVSSKQAMDSAELSMMPGSEQLQAEDIKDVGYLLANAEASLMSDAEKTTAAKNIGDIIETTPTPTPPTPTPAPATPSAPTPSTVPSPAVPTTPAQLKPSKTSPHNQHESHHKVSHHEALKKALDKMEGMGPQWHNRAIALRFYIEKNHWKDYEAAAVIGNFCVEAAGCELRPGIAQFGGGPGRGIAQWGSSDARFDRYGYDGHPGTLVWFAKTHNVDVNALSTQLDFSMWEMHHTETGALAKLHAAKNWHEATYAILNYYERPASRIGTMRYTKAAETLRMLHHLTDLELGKYAEAPKKHPASYNTRKAPDNLQARLTHYLREYGLPAGGLELSGSASGLAQYVLTDSGVRALGLAPLGGYPASWQYGSGADPYGMYKRQCVSYAMDKVHQNYGKTPQWGGRGNAWEWERDARAEGISVDKTPAAGSVMQWGYIPGYREHHTRVISHASYGHVAFVHKVMPDGSLLMSEMNFDGKGGFRYTIVSPQLLHDTTHQTPIHFIHFEQHYDPHPHHVDSRPQPPTKHADHPVSKPQPANQGQLAVTTTPVTPPAPVEAAPVTPVAVETPEATPASANTSVAVTTIDDDTVTPQPLPGAEDAPVIVDTPAEMTDTNS